MASHIVDKILEEVVGGKITLSDEDAGKFVLDTAPKLLEEFYRRVAIGLKDVENFEDAVEKIFEAIHDLAAELKEMVDARKEG
jgi:hypothetical protein